MSGNAKFDAEDLEVVDLLRTVPDFPPMEFEEIAELTGVSKQAIEVTYKRALQKVRKKLVAINNGELVRLNDFDPQGQGPDICRRYVTRW